MLSTRRFLFTAPRKVAHIGVWIYLSVSSASCWNSISPVYFFKWTEGLPGNYQCFCVSLFWKCHCFYALKIKDYSIIRMGSNERKNIQGMNFIYAGKVNYFLNGLTNGLTLWTDSWHAKYSIYSRVQQSKTLMFYLALLTNIIYLILFRKNVWIPAFFIGYVPCMALLMTCPQAGMDFILSQHDLRVIQRECCVFPWKRKMHKCSFWWPSTHI